MPFMFAWVKPKSMLYPKEFARLRQDLIANDWLNHNWSNPGMTSNFVSIYTSQVKIEFILFWGEVEGCHSEGEC